MDRDDFISLIREIEYPQPRRKSRRVETGPHPVQVDPKSERTIEIVELIFVQLREYSPYVVSYGANHLSYYLGFRDLPGGSRHKMRISNHTGVKGGMYSYKWEIRWDGKKGPGEWTEWFADPMECVEAFKAYYSSPMREIYG